MGAVIYVQTVEPGQQVVVTDLPMPVGSKIRITIEPEDAPTTKPFPTVKDWLESGLIGIWNNRTDIGDSTEYVNRMRRR